MSQTLKQLQEILAQRRAASPDSSYVASLHAKGLNKILEKVGEESTEFLLARKDNDKENAIYECGPVVSHAGGFVRLGFNGSGRAGRIGSAF